MSHSKNDLYFRIVSRRVAEVCFEGESIDWNVFVYFRNQSNWNHDIFAEINDYLKTFSIEKKRDIFNTFKEIKYVLDSYDEDKDSELKFLSVKLLAFFDLNDVYNWVRLKANVVVPSNIDVQYIGGESSLGSRARTYIKEDYQWLVSLSVILRVMMPIWGHYIDIVARSKGNNYKEYISAALIERSELMKSAPMQKLIAFIGENIPHDKQLYSVTLSAFSSEDFPKWLLALVIVRKLTVEDLRGLNENSHLIKILFQYIRNKIRNINNNFTGIIREKFQVDDSIDEENKASKLEGYRVKQSLSPGDIELIIHSLSDPMVIGKQLLDDIDEKLLRESLTVLPFLNNTVLESSQKSIMQIIFNKIINPKAFYLLPKNIFNQLICVTQSVLWQKGYYELAMLSSATRVFIEEEYISVDFTGARSRITKDQLDQLDYLFPYKKKPFGKQRALKKDNLAVLELEEISDSLLGTTWNLNIPDSWIDEFNSRSGKNLQTQRVNHLCPNNIRVLLAELLIDVTGNRLTLPQRNI